MPSPLPGRALFGRMPALRLLLDIHVIVLVAIRLVSDADDFNNWDLISFLNANAFRSLRALLALPHVHLRNPFSFPTYNTGAESVISILLHRAMSGVSLYWSNVAVLAVYDAVFFLGLWWLFRLVFADALLESLAWMFVAMSPVVLTFASISAFDMQAFANIVLALLGCELVLSSRPLPGIVLLALSFLCISQAYPLTFFQPLFCVAWLASRSVTMDATPADPAGNHGFGHNARTLALIVAGCTAVVAVGSWGNYLGKTLDVVADSRAYSHGATLAEAIAGRVALLLQVALLPTEVFGTVESAFAPWFLLVALAGLTILALSLEGKGSSSRDPGTTISRLRSDGLAVAAWAGLVAFGYSPALFGDQPKSQRCEFGDIFLAMAVVALAGRLIRRDPRLRGGRLIAPLLALLCASDAYYLSSVLGVDHLHNHRPVFDYDTADGVVRHDLDSAIRQMREQVSREQAGLVVYYPRGRTENTTDPAMFFARFLRNFGPYSGREDLVFPCHFCDVRYGCAFPEVRRKPCGAKCCYSDPAREIPRRAGLRGKKLYLWWFTDPEFEDQPRQSRVLAALRRSYRINDLGVPSRTRRWHYWELVPRGDPDRRRRSPQPGSAK